jgi:hypothetical protein
MGDPKMADRSVDAGSRAESTGAGVDKVMMTRWAIQIILGAIVLATGVLLLVQAVTGSQAPGLLWACLLAAGSAAFWYAFFAQPSWWWAAIPGGALLGAAAAALMALDPAGAGRWTGAAFLAILSTGFWAVYLQNHRRWWAVVPGGTLLTLAVVSGSTEVVGGRAAGAILFFGLALTFVLVAVLPNGRSRQWWPWIVAAALGVFALVVSLQDAALLTVATYVGPIAVIAGGAYLLWSAWRRRRAAHEPSTPVKTDTR